ncbi:hypothetical protein GGR56DRAFT_646966 [Xylariaceae sp. FL0804]|nr:hypothetical protein GGR56DRAFT_646966 [Xylariaceae sp. FL0804]
MTTFYDATIGTLISNLKAQQNLLKKGEAYAAEKGIPVSELEAARLAPDMWDLSWQLLMPGLVARMMAAGITGTEPDLPEVKGMTIAEGHEFISGTLEILAAIKPEAANAREDAVVVHKWAGQDIPGTNGEHFRKLMLPNVFFHCITTYNILRMKGVPLTKPDYANSF